MGKKYSCGNILTRAQLPIWRVPSRPAPVAILLTVCWDWERRSGTIKNEKSQFYSTHTCTVITTPLTRPLCRVQLGTARHSDPCPRLRMFDLVREYYGKCQVQSRVDPGSFGTASTLFN